MFNIFSKPKDTAPAVTKRKLSKAGADMIKAHERCVLKAYLPTPNDKPTIGYGHTGGVKMGDVITQAEADIFFMQDIEWAEAAINSLVTVPLTQNQFDALVSLVFNIGLGNFSDSSLLVALNKSQYQVAADKFLQWNKQRNKRTGKLEVLNGLTKRRKEERTLFLS